MSECKVAVGGRSGVKSPGIESEKQWSESFGSVRAVLSTSSFLYPRHLD